MIKRYGELVVSEIGGIFLAKVQDFGRFILFSKESIQNVFKLPIRHDLILQQIEFIGHQSMGIVLLSGFFTGAVFGLQLGGIFQIFSVEALMGGATGKALTRELAPLMVAFLTAGRTGSAMTAEIATMKVNEQVDAMESMAVDPINYLVAPRVIATSIVMPLLCILFIFIGVVGSFIVAIGIFSVDLGLFIDKITWLVQVEDVADGLQKSLVFSFIISLVACRFGLTASGGAKGVGVATTNAVVLMLLATLAFDFIITYIQFQW